MGRMGRPPLNPSPPLPPLARSPAKGKKQKANEAVTSLDPPGPWVADSASDFSQPSLQARPGQDHGLGGRRLRPEANGW